MAWQDETENYVDTMDKELLSRRAQNNLRRLVANTDALLSGDAAAYSGSFEGRPSAAEAGDGAVISVTNFGPRHVRLVSDGTYWRPLNGSAVLWQYAGSIAAPAASLTMAGVFAFFALPSMRVPANLLFPGAKLRVTAFLRRSAAGGSPASANISAFWNPVDLVSAGQVVATQAMTTAVGTQGMMFSEAYVGSLAGYTPTINTIPGAAVTTGSTDRAMPLNADSFIYIGASSSFEAGAVFQLINFTVELVG